MSISIHHNTAKKAKKYGVELRVTVDEVDAVYKGKLVASAPSANTALAQAIAKLGLDAINKPKTKANSASPLVKTKPRARKVQDEDEEEDEEEDSGSDSIVKRKYKQRYRPFHMTCGDDLSKLISKHVSYKDDADEQKIDPAKLRQFAQANGCWVSGYSKLNVGQQRMNVGNRLRAKVRKGHKIVWA